MHLIPLITCHVKNLLADNQDSLDGCITSLWILPSFSLLYPMEMLSFHYGRKQAYVFQDWTSAAILHDFSVNTRGHAPTQKTRPERTRPHTEDMPRGHAPTQKTHPERTRPHTEDTQRTHSPISALEVVPPSKRVLHFQQETKME